MNKKDLGIYKKFKKPYKTFGQVNFNIMLKIFNSNGFKL